MKKWAWGGYLAAVHVLALVGALHTSRAVTLAGKLGIQHPMLAAAIERARDQQRGMDAQVPKGAAIFLGDSITYGLVASAVAPDAVNFAISGQTSSQLLAGMDAYHSLARASRVYLMIGTNDLLQSHEAGLQDRYLGILAAVPADVPVVFSSVPPLRGTDVSAAVADGRAACSARAGCTFVDVYDRLAGEPGASVADGIHLSLRGYELWTSLLAAKTAG